jgi:hypothetical protein
MLEKCFIYFDNVKASIVLDVTNFKKTIIHGNTNQTMALNGVNKVDGVYHVYYTNKRG